MDRVVRGTAATISVTFTVDGVPTDPNPATATIEIDRDDGTVLVPAGTATTHDTAGVFQYTLTPAQTAELEILTAKWTATLGGQQQTLTTVIEVAGGVLFSITQARKVEPFKSDAATYPTADIVTARTLAETALEDECRIAFVPRYRREIVDGRYGQLLLLERPRPLAIRSIKRDGVPFGADQLATVRLRSTGALFLPTGWMRGAGNYEVAYEHGHAYPPPRAARAALVLARRWLVESPLDERTTRVDVEGGRIEFLTAVGDAFDLPEVNAVVRAYGAGPLVA